MKTRFLGLFLVFSLVMLSACQSGRETNPQTSVTPSIQVQPTEEIVRSAVTVQSDTPTASLTPLAELSPSESTSEPNASLTLPSPTLPEATPTAAPVQSTEIASNTNLPTQPPDRNCQDQAAFYGDVTIPDGSFYRAGERFVKTWRLRNTGDCIWTPDYQVVYAGGEIMNSPLAVPFPGVINPGEQIDISIGMQAPGRGGSFTSNWELSDPSGKRFGTGQPPNTPFWVTISVSYVDSQGDPLSHPVQSSASAQTNLPGASSAELPTAALPPGCPGSMNPAITAEVIHRINQARQADGMADLTENSQLAAAAQSHSADMAYNNFLNHTGSDGSSWYDRVAGQGYPANKAREIIYAGTPGYGGDPAGAVEWWMNSAVHRANILNDEVSEIGVGYVLNPASDFSGYYTVLFGRP